MLRRFERQGGGVYAVQGSLEDYPMVREALAVLERAGEATRNVRLEQDGA